MELNQLVLVDICGCHSSKVRCVVTQVLDVAVGGSTAGYVPVVVRVVNNQVEGNRFTLAIWKGFTVEGVEVSFEKFHY